MTDMGRLPRLFKNSVKTLNLVERVKQNGVARTTILVCLYEEVLPCSKQN